MDSEAPSVGRYVVYGLYDPRDERLRYVGFTSNDHQRLVAHASPKGQGGTKAWRTELKALGLNPRMEVLSRHRTKAEAIDAEVSAIVRLKPDLNKTAERRPGRPPIDKGGDTVITSIRITKAMDGALRAAGPNVSEAIRLILEDWLKRQEKKR